MTEVEFLKVIRDNYRTIGYGRMMQIIAHDWEAHHPGAGLIRTLGSFSDLITADERRAYLEARRSDPLASVAGWSGEGGELRERREG